ncbi:PTS sugar transporter subunit IIA [Halobacillus salinarum]|uniref:PTS sugar transporter subunit IIA n=1 Tax=Halobacillus salinarum TaxID=2932257 RepID=A0ABY4EN08_9BACI|nr:PTS sugar transporter subunit IIA [Halobacillus salinarum]UOQ45523.1 PTS sugar transporter subunit IIA [Halobacillus salinarum]
MSDIYLDESIILLNLEGSTKEEVLTAMGQNLADKNLVKDSFVQAIIDREKEFATGLPTAGLSVAIPHTDVEHVNQKNISVAVLKKEVEFGVMGDDEETTPVKLVFMLAMDEPHSQLTLLQKLMQVFQNEDTLQYLARQTDEANIKQLLEDQLNFSEI